MRSLEHWLQPVGLIWCVFLWGTVVLWRRRHYRWSLGCLAIAAAIWIIGATPLAVHLLARLERPYAEGARNPPAADAVVMLGGTHNHAPRTVLPVNFSASADRVTTAVELIRLGRAPTLVLGGSGYLRNGAKLPDSELLEEWIRTWNLPVNEVLRLGACANTHDEAQRCAAIFQQRGWKQVLLVTTASHLPRAEAVFRRAGIQVIPVGCDFIGLDALDHPERAWRVVPANLNFSWWETWLHEEIGWWWYRARGWI